MNLRTDFRRAGECGEGDDGGQERERDSHDQWSVAW
jgi:hypothetical protein